MLRSRESLGVNYEGFFRSSFLFFTFLSWIEADGLGWDVGGASNVRKGFIFGLDEG